MIAEDIITIICRDEPDAQAVKVAWQTANPGPALDIVVRPVNGMPIMAPQNSGPKPVIFSVRVSDAVASAWVVTIQKH